jgi:hypothetical protein
MKPHIITPLSPSEAKYWHGEISDECLLAAERAGQTRLDEIEREIEEVMRGYTVPRSKIRFMPPLSPNAKTYPLGLGYDTDGMPWGIGL